MSRQVRTARSLFSVLAPMMGAQSTGVAMANAIAVPTILPVNSYAVPVVNGQLVFDAMVKTVANSLDVAAPHTTVTVPGTVVPIKSVIAGAHVNLPASTPLRWLPPVDGISGTGAVNTPGLTGGTAATFFGSAAQVVLFESLEANTATKDLFNGKIGRFPALVFKWDSADSFPGASRVSRDHVLLRDNWVLAIVVSRSDATELRSAEGFEIMQNAACLLSNRCDIDGEVFSAPEPLNIQRMTRVTATPQSYIYAIEFTTTRTLDRIRGEGNNLADFSDWLSTRYNFETHTDPPLPTVEDAIYPQ